MGWTTTSRPSGQSIKEFFQREFGGENSAGIKWDVIRCSATFNVAYLAIRKTFPDGREVVSATVCLIRHMKDSVYNFGYRDICESCGPTECNCPASILKLLSPLSEIATPGDLGYEWAKNWRECCQDNLDRKKKRPKLIKGNIIQFEQEFEFSDGLVTDTLEIVSSYPRVRFKPLGCQGHQTYRIIKGSLRRCNWKLVGVKGVILPKQLHLANGVFNLLSKELKEKFRMLGKQDETDDPIVAARFVNDLGWIWLTTEFDERRDVFWGFASFSHDHNDDWGTIALKDLKLARFKRDVMFEPQPMSKVMPKAVVLP